MLNIDQEYKDRYHSDGGKKLRLVFYKEEYRALYPSETLFPSEQLYPSGVGGDAVDFILEDDVIRTDSMRITESLCSDESLNFGACECAAFEITVSGLSQNISGREFLLTEQFGGYELTLGLYTVDSTPKQGDRDTRKIIAYDRMKRFDSDVAGWYNLLTFPMPLKDFRSSLCEFVGIPQKQTELVNDEMEIKKTIEPAALNGRDVLRYICQMNGVFGNITKNGELQYIAVPKSESVSVEIERYQAAESEEYQVPDIDTVKLQQEDGDIGGTSEGEGQNVYIVEGNFLVYGKTTSELIAAANGLKSVISGLAYTPASVSLNASPWLEVGDRIMVSTSDGPVNTIIMKRELTGIQGAMDQLSSTGSQELTRVFNIESEIIQIKGKTAILNRTVEEVSNNLADLETNTSSMFKQTAEQITAEVKRAKEAESAIKIQADGIQSDVKSFKENTSSMFKQTAEQITAEVKRAKEAESAIKIQADGIQSDVKSFKENTSSMFKQTAEQIALKVAKGDVSSQLSLEKDKITLSGNRLIINSTNFKLDGDGNATFSGNITGGTIKIGTGFSVSNTGAVNASGVDITGTVKATSGYIGKWNIQGDILVGGDEAHIQGGHVETVSLDVYYAGSRVLSADATSDEIIAYADIIMRTPYMNGWGISDTFEDVYRLISDLDDRIGMLE